VSDETDFLKAVIQRNAQAFRPGRKESLMTFVTSIIFVAIISSAAAVAGRADLLFDAEGWQIEEMPDLR